MMKKLISITLIAAAALMTVTIPSAHAGKYSSYDTPWTISCTGNVLGTLYLISRLGIGSPPAGCSSSGTSTSNSGIVHTSDSAAPTIWTWSMPGCFSLHNKPISNKVGVGVPYNCFSNLDGTGDLISSGTVTVGKPVGSTLP